MNHQAESARHAHVLILDDDEDLALAMKYELEPRDHEVRLVHNLDAAWSELTARAPDVFIVDLYIGTRRSDQLIKTVREVLPQVRCVLVSGSVRFETRGRTCWNGDSSTTLCRSRWTWTTSSPSSRARTGGSDQAAT